MEEEIQLQNLMQAQSQQSNQVQIDTDKLGELAQQLGIDINNIDETTLN